MKNMKLTSMLLAGMLTLCSAAMPIAAETDAFSLGDLNGDSKITVSDAILLARVNAEDPNTGISEAGLAAADVNGDGTIDSGDVTALLRFVAGLDSGLGESELTFGSAKNLMADITPQTAENNSISAEFLDAQLAFSANLLKQTSKDKEAGENLLISPFSVALALGMTANGAKGDTLAEMENVLGDQLDINTLDQNYQSLMLNAERAGKFGKAELSIANSIWVRDDPVWIIVPELFLQKTADYFRAEAYGVPIFDSTALHDVNLWTNEKTHGMIPQIVPEEPEEKASETVMILVNALAFEADWDTPYTTKDVYDSTFHAADGTQQDIRMMWSEESTYLESDSAVGFKKYYDGSQYSFAAVLPNEGISVEDYVSSLDGKAIKDLLDSATTQYHVEAALPRFTFDYSRNLNDDLKAMGMPSAFSDKTADFTALNENPATGDQTFISKVLHKTHIQVDEKGTRAGAATAVMMDAATAVMPDYYREVRLDRPFLFMIVDEKTQLPVFIGTVSHIEESEE